MITLITFYDFLFKNMHLLDLKVIGKPTWSDIILAGNTHIQ